MEKEKVIPPGFAQMLEDIQEAMEDMATQSGEPKNGGSGNGETPIVVEQTRHELADLFVNKRPPRFPR